MNTLTEKLANDVALAVEGKLFQANSTQKIAINLKLHKLVKDRMNKGGRTFIEKQVAHSLLNRKAALRDSGLEGKLRNLATRVNRRGGADSKHLVQYIDDAAGQANMLRLNSPKGHGSWMGLADPLKPGDWKSTHTIRRGLDNVGNKAIVATAPYMLGAHSLSKKFTGAADIADLARDSGVLGNLRNLLGI